ncbi:MAG: hypothetical protein HYY18_00305 [Planctomycetes bacterium]|nr:hypothetical protein [Planctomycetota bacterium]
MNKKPLLAIGGVGLLALAVTVGLFLAGDRGSSEPKVTGKLSKRVVEIETKYKDLQDQWRAHEAAFREKKEFPLLAKLNDGFQEVGRTAAAAKGETDPEKEALPHLVKSIEASARVPTSYMLLQVNPGVLKEHHWAETKANAETANREWKEWVAKTEGWAR